MIFEFSITGRGRKGADGMAFWYTQDRMVSGEVFGSKDNWRGLGIFFDTYDNDNKRNNPSIYAIVNDGTMSFDHQNDGGANILASCSVGYRNKKNHVFVKVRYVDSVLELFYDLEGKNNWNTCFKVGATISKNYFFGFSAATGGLADQHALYSFSTFSFEADQYTGDNYINEYINSLEEAANDQKKVDDSVNKKDILKELENLNIGDVNLDEKLLKQIEEMIKEAKSTNYNDDDQEEEETENKQEEKEKQQQKPKKVEKKESKPTKNEKSNDDSIDIKELQDKLTELESVLTKHMFDVVKFQKLMTEALQTIITDENKDRDVKLDTTLSNLKEEISQTKKILVTGINEKINKVNKDISSITTQLDSLKYSAEALKNDMTTMGQLISKSKEYSSRSLNSYSFMIYLILFQVIFAITILLWKKLREDSKRKVY